MSDTDGQAGKVRHAIDVKKLGAWLESQAPAHFETPLTLKQFGYGQSNPSYQVKDVRGRKYVLRKQPPGALVAKSAHRVDREFEMLRALEATNVPVPKVYVLCTDRDVIGTQFYIMEFLQGRIFHSPEFPGVSPEDRTRMWHAAIDTAARLHAVDPRKIDLPKSWTERMSSHYPRQVRTLAKVAEAQAATKDKEGEELGPIPDIDTTLQWMDKHLPRERIGIVHGDYKIDNLVFHATEPRVIGVLDWELCTIGHPLADLGNLLQPYSLPADFMSGADQFLLRQGTPGLPARDALLELYGKAVGWDPRADWTFAVVYAHIRLAVIIHGIAARVQLGQASSPQAERIAPMYGLFADLAKTAIEEAPASAKL